jgi:hypothetical protein
MHVGKWRFKMMRHENDIAEPHALRLAETRLVHDRLLERRSVIVRILGELDIIIIQLQECSFETHLSVDRFERFEVARRGCRSFAKFVADLIDDIGSAIACALEV